jgi:hypothetical protein
VVIGGRAFLRPDPRRPRVVARRARVINRFFMPEEMMAGGPGNLDRHLDRNVTVIEPRKTEERMEQYFAGAKTPAEAQRA